MRVTTTRWRAALARLSPPRLSRWRVVLPLEAGTGQAPHSFANAASERIRSGLSPTRSSIAAAVPAPIPCAWTSSGARAAGSVSRWPSWPWSSSSSTSQRRAIARRLAFADAAVEVIGPGRRAARCRIRAILPVMRSSRSRSAAGGPTMNRLQRHHGLGPSLDRGVARDLEVADHLDRAGARLRRGGGLPAERGAGGTLGVERVALALPAPQLPVGSVDLENGMPLRDQEA